MRAIIAVMCCFGFAVAVPAFAQEGGAKVNPIDVDPNTKIEGGADVRGSGAAAGAGAGSDKKVEIPPDKRELEKDKPISERKPQEEREPEEAAKRDSAPQRQ